MDKVKVSQDFLFQRLKEHSVTISMIARKMGSSEGIVRSCFNHNMSRHGKPLSFSASSVVRLNVALELIANELRESLIVFGTDQQFTNQRGTTYDPGTLPAFQRLGEYFKMKGLTEKVLGWNKTKCDTTLSVKSSPMYGRVTQDDVSRINAEVLAVAGYLGGIEVELSEGSSSSSDEPKAAVSEKDKGTRTRKGMEAAFESPKHEWDDTTLPLQERSRLFREHQPNGVLLFRVNGGYTAEGDDADYIHGLDADVYPYHDVVSGLTTAYMDEAALQRVLPRIIADGRRVMFANMYDD